MRTKFLLLSLCAIILPLSCIGQVSLSNLVPSEDPVSNEVAKALLSKAYMHHPSLLSNAEVKIIDSQTDRSFRLAASNSRLKRKATFS